MKYFCHQRDRGNTKHQTPNTGASLAAWRSARPPAFFLGVVCLLSAVLTTPIARGQTNTASESRYLLIFDTSSAMKRRSENVQRAVGELISSGMNGQLRGGDTIGVWTFNEALYAGNLPLIRWTTERRLSTASRVTEFLRAQKFEKQSRLDVVLPVMQQVVTNSPKLTVLFFTDGSNPLSGTPFDAEIKAAYEPFRETQRKERMPFVTVLRVKDGDYLGYAVTPAPWVVEFPKFPPAPVVVAPKVEPKLEAPRPTVPPLIVIGKKTETNIATAVLPQPGSEPKVTQKPGMTEAEKLFARLAAEQGLTIQPAANSEAATNPSGAATNPPTSAPPENAQPVPIPTATEISKPTPAPVESKIAAAKTDIASTPPSVVSNPLANETNLVPAVQAVVPVDKNSARLLLLGAGVSLLVVALGVVYALMSRRRRPPASLITSSMDRDRK